ncbi:APH-domain-containing protein [Cryphonectria parasitica EP155]|uniref:APH-domain-containing protein n=1 Tax=Cryphonectria parasitica (strain ATCC 38755 / EP155) TaxID=660469 RepID=A0A9P5CQG6_CRYP1|nr:APH-domain-containing protein [Cryphonectria parasitica EP155]KAF3767509.1 APH-domain-containing protein [Cryphonectria parasitica EP155]
MGTPQQYLPPTLSDPTIQSLLTSLSLPPAKLISPLIVAAAYHTLYLLTFPPEANAQGELAPALPQEPDGSTTLVLRVSGRHLPRIKTTNEVAVMQWVRANTSIPVPAVVRFDATEANPLGHEYTLLERAPGISVDKVLDRLDEAARRDLVAQLADLVAQLHAHEWTAVGGLEPSSADGGGSAIVPGQVLDETFWQAPDVERYWPGGHETVSTLNIGGPYESYTALCAASVDKYVYAIERHERLAWMRDLVPRLRAFVGLLRGGDGQGRARELKLDDTRLVLAHRDLHFANIMLDPLTNRITGILDWEFAGVVPASRWNPVKAFLWNMKEGDESRAEKAELMRVFEEVCAVKGLTILSDARANEYQEAMQLVVNYVRAIVEVCPRGEKEEAAREWRRLAEEAMRKLGV